MSASSLHLHSWCATRLQTTARLPASLLSDLSEDHPGYLDTFYKQRRADICNLAREHRM